MNTLDLKSLAAFIISVCWKSNDAVHTENYLAPRVNMWRDIFPPNVSAELSGRCEGDTCSFDFPPGEILPAYDHKKIHTLPRRNFSPPQKFAHITPAMGRFYPQGFLTGVSTIYPQSILPMRVIELSAETASFDCNHPLAGKAIHTDITLSQLQATTAERGGRCSDWLECAVQDGPGMQARWNAHPTDFEITDPLPRLDEKEDPLFYSTPRLVQHVDSLASSFLQKEYAKIIQPGDRILDLMSSMHSHLPSMDNISVDGLGLNRQELLANRLLTGHVVHDLNAHPSLPFKDGEFTVVLCSLSVEYVIHPQKVIQEAARVLAPGGSIVISFSNRWFPGKVTGLWTRLHEFERIGFVLELLMNTGCLEEYTTITYRNWPRPANDRHAATISTSDPIYIVRARKNISSA